MRIALVNIGGVRTLDPYLAELGMRFPGIRRRAEVIQRLPGLGLLTLAACTPQEHEVYYFEVPFGQNEPASLYECDLVAMTLLTAQAPDAYALADRLRQRGVRVALGGLHVTARTEEAAQHADFVFCGEGENIWRQALQAIQNNEPRQMWYARDFLPVNMDELPVPRYDLLQGGHYSRFTVQTTRGCPWRCDFCGAGILLRPNYRKRPVAHVVRDIEAIKRIYSRPFIEFADDNTFADHDWGKALCEALIPLEIRWFTETDISIAEDEELLRLMRRAGCREVLIGLESPSPQALQGVELRADYKAKKAHDYLEAVRRIQKAGILVNGCFILGLDGQGPEVFDAIYEFAQNAPLFDVQLTILTPFPGTPLYDRLLREGRLLFPDQWERYTLFEINFEPRGMTREQLRLGFYRLVERLYAPAAVEQRRSRLDTLYGSEY